MLQSTTNLHGIYGLPLCVSGFTHHLTFSKQMADHDERRKAMKEKRSAKEMGNDLQRRSHGRVLRDQINEADHDYEVVDRIDLATILQDLYCVTAAAGHFACAAKSA
ncbi:uncharacterized protein LOC110808574 [Carica papaya]|uniref:uncharacterized protein LOC110808574 n=1 Tax=Carica papaya TaxID=3649 RepID=UPI000B8C9C7F|nr:uncharacterized protein LOC110808574 [Carica papaya]